MKVAGMILVISLCAYVAYESMTNDKSIGEIVPSFTGDDQGILDIFLGNKEAITDMPPGDGTNFPAHSETGILPPGVAPDASGHVPGELSGVATDMPPHATDEVVAMEHDGSSLNAEGGTTDLPAFTPGKSLHRATQQACR